MTSLPIGAAFAAGRCPRPPRTVSMQMDRDLYTYRSEKNILDKNGDIMWDKFKPKVKRIG